MSSLPSLSLAINSLSSLNREHFVIWVIQSPLPGGYAHHDLIWSPNLTQIWLAWQSMFSLQEKPQYPVQHSSELPSIVLEPKNNSELSYGGRLMQELGISLWEWVFSGSIEKSLAQSQGLAIGKNCPLRVRLEIRDPNLISLPWEIMQPDAGQQSISLNSQIFFSRTTTEVKPLAPQKLRKSLNILLVLGQSGLKLQGSKNENLLKLPSGNLNLEKEAELLKGILEDSATNEDGQFSGHNPIIASVHTLIQPTVATLVESLNRGSYGLFFYAGHGTSGPDGGNLFLREDAVINGTELAHILVANKVTLAVFNSCWGAQPQRNNEQFVQHSSLAEVLIQHGVPAVLAMRDSITDQEALNFISIFTHTLTESKPIDQAAQIARQQLLTLYRFNQPAWTLPILYMHPDFDGFLIEPLNNPVTELPTMTTDNVQQVFPVAYICVKGETERITYIYGGLMRVGRLQENDLVIAEKWVSQRHAEIICREIISNDIHEYIYYLRDFSRFGTFINTENGWQRVHHREVILRTGNQIKFGSLSGQLLEFIIKDSS